MRFHIQPASIFCIRPRVRIYRRPLLIWIRWFGRSFYFDRSQSVTATDGKVAP